MIGLQQHESIVIPAGRGTIFDRAGVQLAIGEQATTVYADPKEIVNARAVANAAAQTLGVDANALYPQLVDRSKGFVYVAREADPAKAAEWYRRAAEQGATIAQLRLGCLYLGGEGVPRDPEAGVEWLRRAAEAGFHRVRNLEDDQQATIGRDVEHVQITEGP